MPSGLCFFSQHAGLVCFPCRTAWPWLVNQQEGGNSAAWFASGVWHCWCSCRFLGNASKQKPAAFPYISVVWDDSMLGNLCSFLGSVYTRKAEGFSSSPLVGQANQFCLFHIPYYHPLPPKSVRVVEENQKTSPCDLF